MTSPRIDSSTRLLLVAAYTIWAWPDELSINLQSEGTGSFWGPIEKEPLFLAHSLPLSLSLYLSLSAVLSSLKSSIENAAMQIRSDLRVVGAVDNAFPMPIKFEPDSQTGL